MVHASAPSGALDADAAQVNLSALSTLPRSSRLRDGLLVGMVVGSGVIAAWMIVSLGDVRSTSPAEALAATDAQYIAWDTDAPLRRIVRRASTDVDAARASTDVARPTTVRTAPASTSRRTRRAVTSRRTATRSTPTVRPAPAPAPGAGNGAAVGHVKGTANPNAGAAASKVPAGSNRPAIPPGKDPSRPGNGR